MVSLLGWYESFYFVEELKQKSKKHILLLQVSLTQIVIR